MSSVYEIVTERIITKLQEGTVPWQRPWRSGQTVSWSTQKPYRGINQMLLDPGEYATFNQIKEAGGKVKKGAKSEIVVFWKRLEVDDKETGEKKEIPFLRYYRVFEINHQCEGITSRRKDEPAYEHEPITEAEKIKEGYRTCPPITFQPGRAFYRPSVDVINVPAIIEYHKPEKFYSTMFHEMVHSTGHRSRLNRLSIQGDAAFGSESYSKEELIAEIGAAMLCGVAGIENATIDNSASYINSWIRKLKNDPKLIVHAASAAQKAAEYIQGIENK